MAVTSNVPCNHFLPFVCLLFQKKNKIKSDREKNDKREKGIKLGHR